MKNEKWLENFQPEKRQAKKKFTFQIILSVLVSTKYKTKKKHLKSFDEKYTHVEIHAKQTRCQSHNKVYDTERGIFCWLCDMNFHWEWKTEQIKTSIWSDGPNMCYAVLYTMTTEIPSQARLIAS